MILKSLSNTSRSFHHLCCFWHGSTHFLSSHTTHATLGYISLNVKKDSGATFKTKERKKRKKREEKVRRERERKGQVSY
jgi:CelD/BcsL family acetyltransferase involved in cellulose biosynthesis